jgi:hypothetical protein
MTHSLHRQPPASCIDRDFVLLLTPPPGAPREELREVMVQLIDEVIAAGPANIGSYAAGSAASGVTLDEIRAGILADARIRATFSSREALLALMRRIEALDYGISMVVGGQREAVLALGREAGLAAHTLNLSCGFHGPSAESHDPQIESIVTQCGHGMISRRLAAATIRAVQAGTMDAGEGAARLCRPCVCGIANPMVMMKILERPAAAAAGDGKGPSN